MSITAKEIATLAHVSRGTVDRALKGRSGIKAETKNLILEIAKKHDYKPNLIGKALVYSGKTIKVAVILNSIGNPFFDDVKRGIFAAEEELNSYGIKVSLSEFKGYDAYELMNCLNTLPEDTENVILTPICNVAVEEKINELTNKGVHVVTLSSALENAKKSVYIGCNYLKSGKIAGRLTGLLSSGNANLFIVTGSSLHQGHKQRVEGISQIIRHEYPNIHLIGAAENQDDDKIAYSTMKEILQKNPEIDFVYITAGGVNGTLRAIHDSGKDIKVCSFDDTVLTREALLNGSILATICQQPFEQGYQSVRAIFDIVVTKKSVAKHIYSELSVKIDQSL